MAMLIAIMVIKIGTIVTVLPIAGLWTHEHMGDLHQNG
jgi:hypothetical protein